MLLSSIHSEVKAKPKQEALWPSRAGLRGHPGSHQALVSGLVDSRLLVRVWGQGVLI